MQKLVLLAIAVMFTFFAGEAAGEELLLTCAWDRGGKFDLRIGNGVSRNGQKIADVFSISDRFVTWHEVSPTATDCEYSADRRTGVLIASTFSKLFDRKVENRGSCIKPENTPKIGS